MITIDKETNGILELGYWDRPGNINYEDIIDSMGYWVEFQVDDVDWQGDIHVLLKNDKGEYGILTVGYGSCSGCDTLQSITDYPVFGLDKEKDAEVLKRITKEINDFRNDLINSITWRSKKDMSSYVENKDFGTEFYGHTPSGKEFIRLLERFFFVNQI